ncbi:leucine-rich repeat-containing protein 14 [Polypterus senegalus]|uniref:leucine-rich repeat-containing protein 14 n=1 Tax=Polypterus senegalus TaxID=55291 RepID=UPI001962C8E0|nr:leucine-rich repeat-containing protein 14 [Polypterus senegalus]XP_039609726.1 leucine-rich repeat-containing protein 14 [Polypterus senegalus]
MSVSLVFLCARKVVSDHGSALNSLPYVPHELYPILFKAAFLDQRPLVIVELVRRWPLPVLSLVRLLQGCHHYHYDLSQDRPSRCCLQAVLLTIVKNLTEKTRNGRRVLRVLDLCGVQDEGGRPEPNSMGGLSRTVAIAKACLEVAKVRRGENTTESASKRRRNTAYIEDTEVVQSLALEVEVRADMFVNASSYECVKQALQAKGPMRLLCRDLRAEELSAQRTATLLELLEALPLRRVDLRYNNLGLAGINLLLPILAKFPSLMSLRLLYINVDVRHGTPDTESGLREMAAGLGRLRKLRELNLTSLRLSNKLRLLLSSLERALEVVELNYFYLTSSDLYYLAESPHACFLRKLDLSGNSFSEALIPPLQRLLCEASASLRYLVLSGCNLTDHLVGTLLTSLRRCRNLYSLGCSLNPISTEGLMSLVLVATELPQLQLLVHPQPTDCYEDGLPQPPSYYNLMEFPVNPDRLVQALAELRKAVEQKGRTDLVLSTDLYNYRTADLLEE